MSIHTHEPAYKAALESAQGELDQIAQRMTELRAQKQIIEAAVVALRPIVEAASENAASYQPAAVTAAPVFEITAKSHPVAAEPAAPAPVYRQEPKPAFTGGSLEQQINHALGLAALA